MPSFTCALSYEDPRHGEKDFSKLEKVFDLRTSENDKAQRDHRVNEMNTMLFNSKGNVYHDTAHDIVIRVPDGAIPERKVIEFEIDATLTSSLKLPEDYKLVSPVLLLCVKDDPHFKFIKPIEVIIPHFLDIESNITDMHSQISFMKASHGADHFECIREQKQCFDHHGNYGVLKTDHLCYMCIAAKKSYTDIPQNEKFNLICVTPEIWSATRWSIYFYVTYNLPTCSQVVSIAYFVYIYY